MSRLEPRCLQSPDAVSERRVWDLHFPYLASASKSSSTKTNIQIFIPIRSAFIELFVSVDKERVELGTIGPVSSPVFSTWLYRLIVICTQLTINSIFFTFLIWTRVDPRSLPLKENLQSTALVPTHDSTSSICRSPMQHIHLFVRIISFVFREAACLNPRIDLIEYMSPAIYLSRAGEENNVKWIRIQGKSLFLHNSLHPVCKEYEIFPFTVFFSQYHPPIFLFLLLVFSPTPTSLWPPIASPCFVVFWYTTQKSGSRAPQPLMWLTNRYYYKRYHSCLIQALI